MQWSKQAGKPAEAQLGEARSRRGKPASHHLSSKSHIQQACMMILLLSNAFLSSSARKLSQWRNFLQFCRMRFMGGAGTCSGEAACSWQKWASVKRVMFHQIRTHGTYEQWDQCVAIIQQYIAKITVSSDSSKAVFDSCSCQLKWHSPRVNQEPASRQVPSDKTGSFSEVSLSAG